jgi:predicted transcriptional regulator
MGYAGKLDLKEKAQKLRKQGFSVKQIEKKLGVSRSAVSLWVRDIVLTEKQLTKLYGNRKTGALKGSIIAAVKKIEKRRALVEKFRKEGKKEVANLSKRDKFIAGIALYFAEGSKADSSVSFSNSDPRAIKFIVDWIRLYCIVPREKFRVSLYLHDNLDEAKAKEFWSEVTRIPLAQFRKTYIVKNNPKRLRKTKHIYGVCRITVSDVNLHRKVMGWVEGLFANIIIPR